VRKGLGPIATGGLWLAGIGSVECPFHNRGTDASTSPISRTRSRHPVVLVRAAPSELYHIILPNDLLAPWLTGAGREFP
jgi:hypothetical protein